jgi:predicted DCC family thiol-disulfide oxidoreductase YuxK
MSADTAMTGPRDSGVATHAILYDSDCGFCKWSLDKVLLWDRRERLRPVAIQSREGQALLSDVPAGERLDSWHLVDPRGGISSAGAGAGPLARLLPGGRPLAFVFERFPRTTDRAYRWVADHRALLARLVRVDDACELRRG